MKRLKKIVTACKMKILYGGKCPMLEKIEKQYKKEYNIRHTGVRYKGKMIEDVGKKIAVAYNNLEHLPENKLVQAAYNQMAKEVIDQFNFLNAKEPIAYEPYEGNGEPYKDSYDMLDDFYKYHLYFFKTEAGFGEGKLARKNIMLQKTGIFINGYELVINDVFRIVHDVFGHAMNGYGFGPIGEDLAWAAHISMFSPLAAAALSTETRGQNCWVNFGSHLWDKHGNVRKKNDPKFIPPQHRPFAEQKMNLLPPQVCGIKIHAGNNDGIRADFVPLWDPLKSVLHYK